MQALSLSGRYLGGPSGLSVLDGSLYVADTWNNRVVRLRTSDLSFVAAVGSRGSGPNEFRGPTAVASDGTHLYVADTENDRIEKRGAGQ